METKAEVAIRPAGPRDAEALAALHLACARAQPGGFMHHLGRRFFVAYYRILLAEPTTLVLVAEAGAEGLLGFVSATLESSRQLEALRRGSLGLLLSVIPVLIRSPSLAAQILVRRRALSPAARGTGYCVASGPRIAYWGWSPGHPARGGATALLKELLQRLERLGVTRVCLETDQLNRKAELVHRLLGARVVDVLRTRDGRERRILEYALGSAGGRGAP